MVLKLIINILKLFINEYYKIHMIYNAYKKLSKSLYGSGLGKIGFIRNIHLRLLKDLTPKIVKFEGLKMHHLGFVDIENYNFFNVIKQNVHPGDTVLDIGANIGLWTMRMSKLVGNTGKVYAFEPEVKKFQVLKKNIELNNLDNVVLEQKALSDIDGISYLELSKDSGQHKLSTTGVKIESVTLDNYLKESVDFIKMDAEGSEYKILKGMKNILKNKDVTLVTEFYYKLLDNPIEFINILENHFKIYDMRDDMKLLDKNEFFLKYNIHSGATDLLCK